MSMGERLHPASCCVSSTAEQLVAPNDCGLSVGISAPVPIVLARETVGSWKAAEPNCLVPACITVKICCSTCDDDMIIGCTYCGPCPYLAFGLLRDFTCSCKKTNDFQNNGHYYTFPDKDTFHYHYLCCPATKFVRVGVAPL